MATTPPTTTSPAGIPPAASTTSVASLDADLLRLLRCPVTKSKLKVEGEFLVAEVGGLKYPIRDGIPVMLIEEAVLPEGIKTMDEFKQKFAK